MLVRPGGNTGQNVPFSPQTSTLVSEHHLLLTLDLLSPVWEHFRGMMVRDKVSIFTATLVCAHVGCAPATVFLTISHIFHLPEIHQG